MLREQPTDSRQWQRLIRAPTVPASCFFRDHQGCAALSRYFLPGPIAERRAAGELRMRISSALDSEWALGGDPRLEIDDIR